MTPQSNPASAGPPATPSVESDEAHGSAPASAGWTTFLATIGASVVATIALVATMPAASDTDGIEGSRPVGHLQPGDQRQDFQRLTGLSGAVERRTVELSVSDGERRPWCRAWLQSI